MIEHTRVLCPNIGKGVCRVGIVVVLMERRDRYSSADPTMPRTIRAMSIAAKIQAAGATNLALNVLESPTRPESVEALTPFCEHIKGDWPSPETWITVKAVLGRFKVTDMKFPQS